MSTQTNQPVVIFITKYIFVILSYQSYLSNKLDKKKKRHLVQLLEVLHSYEY